MGQKGIVYLAGPMAGMDTKYVLEWRVYAAARLNDVGVVTLSPARYRVYQQDGYIIPKNHPVINGREILDRDRFDVKRSDIILANFLGAEFSSCGTPIEFGWADILRIPVVEVIEDSGNPYDHDMMNNISGFRRNDLDDAIDLVITLLR